MGQSSANDSDGLEVTVELGCAVKNGDPVIGAHVGVNDPGRCDGVAQAKALNNRHCGHQSVTPMLKALLKCSHG
jgi:hypothetical protein